MLTDSDGAFDVVQAAFVSIYQRYETLDDPGKYLSRTVLNGCRDYARRSKIRRTHLEAAVESAPAADIEVLSDVLCSLPFNQRAALVLKYYGSLTEAEIAEELDCPIGSVGPWIHRALQTLRRQLQ